MNELNLNPVDKLQSILTDSDENVIGIWTNLSTKVIVKMKKKSFENLGNVVGALTDEFNLDPETVQGIPVVDDRLINLQEGYYVEREETY